MNLTESYFIENIFYAANNAQVIGYMYILIDNDAIKISWVVT